MARLYPFAQRKTFLPTTTTSSKALGGSPVVLHSPAAGMLYRVVAEHVVHGRVIFPGAGYLEMARASSSAASAPSAAAPPALSNAFFLLPLALEVQAGGLHLMCEVDTGGGGGSFKVLSGTLDSDSDSDDPLLLQGASSVHCAGALVAPNTRRHPQGPLLFNLPAIRGSWRSGAHAVDVEGSVYASFDAVGLQYGPGYRTLISAWGGREGAVSR